MGSKLISYFVVVFSFFPGALNVPSLIVVNIVVPPSTVTGGQLVLAGNSDRLEPPKYPLRHLHIHPQHLGVGRLLRK